METNSYTKILATWPAPIALSHEAGDVFITFRQKPLYLEAKWNGHISPNDVIHAAQLSILLLQNTGCPAFLDDKLDASGEWYDANDWLQFEWAPQVVKAGLRFFAYVYSRNMLGLYSFDEFKKRLPPELQVRAFHTYEEAQVWLEKESKAYRLHH